VSTSACHVATFLVLLACLPATRANGQTQTEGIHVQDARPVQAAVNALLERYPIVITYEDPKYEFADDIVDLTDRMPHPPKVRVLAPVGGVLQVSYEASKEIGQPVSMAATLNDIVRAKNTFETGGRFQVEQRGDVFHVVPAQIRDAHGVWVNRGSILEAPISMTTPGMDGLELLGAVAKNVNEVSGIRVIVSAAGLTNALRRYRGTVEAKNEPARDVLLRTLHSISPRLSWLLDYDPTFQYYVLNVVLAAEPPPKEIPLDLSKIPRPGDPTPAGPPKR
jgi:hypothetical protein